MKKEKGEVTASTEKGEKEKKTHLLWGKKEKEKRNRWGTLPGRTSA